MALERLVIKKGAFKQLVDQPEVAAAAAAAESKSTSVSTAELLDLLRCDVSLDDVPQSGAISDAALSKILDRSWLEAPEGRLPLPEQGVGYELIAGDQQNTGGMLSSVQ